MRLTSARMRHAVVLALVGGLWTAPIVAQSPSSTGRSVYDRRATADSSNVSASGAAATPPRRLPAGNAGVRPLSKPTRARGYLSQGLADAQRATRRASSDRSAVQPAAGVRLVPTKQTTTPTQGVLPAFFPAPIGVGEPPKTVDSSAGNSQQLAMMLNAPVQGEHPLLPAVRWAKLCMQKMDTIKDYSAKMAKRERIDGTLGDYEYMKVKVRHEPFSVYIGFIGPASVKGQEAIYVKGRNDGNLLGHAGSGVKKLFGTMPLKPDSALAMTGNRYPITELGIRRLTERLIEVGEHDAQFGECEVKAIPNTKINGRECVCLQVVHPVPRNEFTFNKAKIYVDSQLNIPVRYEAFDWPHEPGGEPLLIEEYTYLELKFNNGFTDYDFDVANTGYQFR
jgi:hypothetical protein